MANPNAIGQPFILKDHLKVRADIEDYFKNGLKRMVHGEIYDTDLNAKVWKEYQDGYNMPGIAGLSAHIGTSRRTFFEYLKRLGGKDEELNLIALELLRAKTVIEAAQENGLFDKEAHRGSMFSLKVNFKWDEQTDAGAGGGAFEMKNITPSVDAVAIPKWEEPE